MRHIDLIRDFFLPVAIFTKTRTPIPYPRKPSKGSPAILAYSGDNSVNQDCPPEPIIT